MDNITAIIQARTGSTRLPNKMLLPFFEGKTILELIILRLKSIVNLNLILATTSNRDDDQLEEIAKKLEVPIFRGCEEDVLNRFISAAEAYNCQKIIRVCADNPFLNITAISELMVTANSHKNFDYIGFWVNNRPSIKTHFGFWAEFVTLDALKKVSTITDEKYFHEHVTNFIYENPDVFKIKWIEKYNTITNRDDIRLTIDTEADFTLAQSIYSELALEIDGKSIESIIQFLSSDTVTLEKMKLEIKKNSK